MNFFRGLIVICILALIFWGLVVAGVIYFT